PALQGSALLYLDSDAVGSFPTLKIPDIPAEADMVPFRAESIKHHHLNEISSMGIVENSIRIELFDQHSVQAFSLLQKTPPRSLQTLRGVARLEVLRRAWEAPRAWRV